MVTKKSLLGRIENLERDNAKLKEMVIKSITALNKKISKHLKEEKAESEQSEVIKSWLEDERIEEIQSFINKGVKK